MSWAEIFTAIQKGIIASKEELAKYLPLTGGTLSGALTIDTGGSWNNINMIDHNDIHNRIRCGSALGDYAAMDLTISEDNSDNNRVVLSLRRSLEDGHSLKDNALHIRNVVDGVSTSYNILHTGNSTADKVKAGILGGKVQANHTAQATLNTAQLRNIYIGTAVTEGATSSLPEGTIVFTKE